MKIKFIKNGCFLADETRHDEDEEIEVSDEEGQLCIDNKIAIEILDVEAMEKKVAKQKNQSKKVIE